MDADHPASLAGQVARPRFSASADWIGLAAILVVAIVGYLLFPNNLALLTRVIGIVMLVLSIDLVTGFCGVATLGHAALFGAGAYAAGIAAAHFGITDPIAMIAAGAAGGAVAGLISGLVVLRGHGLGQLVLSIAIVNLFHEAANKAASWTGGSDGLTDIAPSPLFGVFAFDLWGRTAYGLRDSIAGDRLLPAAAPVALPVWHALPRHPAGSDPDCGNGCVGPQDAAQDVRHLRPGRRRRRCASMQSPPRWSGSTA